MRVWVNGVASVHGEKHMLSWIRCCMGWGEVKVAALSEYAC